MEGVTKEHANVREWGELREFILVVNLLLDGHLIRWRGRRDEEEGRRWGVCVFIEGGKVVAGIPNSNKVSRIWMCEVVVFPYQLLVYVRFLGQIGSTYNMK